MADERLWVTAGALDLAEYVLQQVDEVGRPADVDIMVTAAGVKDVRRLAEAQRTGVIGRIRLILDAGTLNIRNNADDGQASNAQDIEDALGPDGVRCIRVHAKAGRLAGPRGAHAFITSANLNRNNRPEQYETVDGFAGSLEAVFDAVFDRVPPGCAKPNGAEAYQGLAEALEQLSRPGLVVYRGSAPLPVHLLANLAADQILIVERAGVGELLEGLIELAGVCSVRASTWNISRGDVHVLAAALVDGKVSKLDVSMPSVFGRRVSNADGYHAVMGLIPTQVRWGPSHAKVLLVRGELETFVVTGGANFVNQGLLDIVRIRRGDAALADLADQLLDALPVEEPPPPPSTMLVQTARAYFEKSTRRPPPHVVLGEGVPLDAKSHDLFLAACASLQINPENLPPGLTPQDIIESVSQAPEEHRARGAGRPRKSDPAIPWTEVHDLLVYGEEYVDEGGARRYRYPGPAEIARRYGCAKSTVQEYIAKHDIEKRRIEVKHEEDAIVAQHIIHDRAAGRVALHVKVESIAHLLADRYLEGLMAPRAAPNHIRVDSIADLRQAIELTQKLGAAVNGDQPDGLRVTVTMENLRDRHKSATRRRVSATIGLVSEEVGGDLDDFESSEPEVVLEVVPESSSGAPALPAQRQAGRPLDPQVARRLVAADVGKEARRQVPSEDPWRDEDD